MSSAASQLALSELAGSQAPEVEELKSRLEMLGVHLVGNEARFSGSHAQAIQHLFTDALSQMEPVEGKESRPCSEEAFAKLVAKLRQVVPLWEVELLSPASGCPPPGVEAVPGPLCLPADEFTRDGILHMHPGHFGPLVVDRPLIVCGHGTVLWSDGHTPALEVRSPGVRLECLVIRGRGKQPALRVTAGHSITAKSLQVFGYIEGLDVPASWTLPAELKISANTSPELIFKFELGVGADCHLETNITGLKVEPTRLAPGVQIVSLIFSEVASESVLLGTLYIVTDGLKRCIPVEARLGRMGVESEKLTKLDASGAQLSDPQPPQTVPCTSQQQAEAIGRRRDAHQQILGRMSELEVPQLRSRQALDACRLKLESLCKDYRNDLKRLAGPAFELEVDAATAEEEAKVFRVLTEREAAYEQRCRDRDHILEMVRVGRIRDAEALASGWLSDFTDLGLGDFHRFQGRWRKLAKFNHAVWVVLGLVVLLAAVAKWMSLQPATPFDVILADEVRLRLIPMPSGVFEIGALPSDEEAEPSERPITLVRLTRRLWLAETEITQAQWQAVMGTDVDQQRQKHSRGDPAVEQGATLPMAFVTWSEAEEFARKLAPRLPPGGMVRLPTEAEWEIACRAGASAQGLRGSRLDPTAGNFKPNKQGVIWQAMPVKSFPANKWGFHDMHGNVGEWSRGGAVAYPGGVVNDWYASETEGERAYRGGSWRQPVQLARASARNWRPGGTAAAHIGFRILWDPESAPRKN